MKNIIKSVLATAICMLMLVCCDKGDEGINTSRLCKVTFVCKINPTAAGDSIFMNVAPGQYVPEIPVIEKPGYYLEGWYTDAASADAGKAATPKAPAYDLAAKPIYLDVIFYARWLAL